MEEEEEKGVEMEEKPKTKSPKKLKVCRGALYDSSSRRAKSKEALCLGFSYPVHNHHTPHTTTAESKYSQGRGYSVSYFKYWCFGYSAPLDDQDFKKTGEPAVCLGLELILRKWDVPSPVHAHKKQEVLSSRSQSDEQNPSASASDNFRERFTRTAGVVATGVGKSSIRVANQIKTRIINIIYPDSKRDD